MTEKRATDQQLAEEARQWKSGEANPRGWIDSPEAIPKVHKSIPISIRMPRDMVIVLKEFARREGIGYQVLMKRWLDERIRIERDKLFAPAQIRLVQPKIIRRAASFGLPDEVQVSDQAALG